MKVSKTKYAAVLLAASLAACAQQDLVGPAVTSGPRSSASQSGAGRPQLIANSQRYRAQTYHHGSNRSGSASLSATAMLGKDGMTDLSIASGRAGEAGAAGNISKAQIKLMDGAGVPQQTLNYNNTSGATLQKSYAGRFRHSKIQVQANVRDIDPKRTDVVTITETVNLRPDIAVTDVSAPAQARPATQVVISSTIAELNHDLGATANCVMYIDGAEADRANGIWVAEGDAVNCQFMHTFPVSGNFTITVKAEDVVPGDYDLANNAASRQIEIVNPEIQLTGSAYLWNYDHEYWYRYNDSWRRSSDGAFWQYSREYRNIYKQEYSYVSAWAPGTAGTSANLSLSLRSVETGATLSSIGGTMGNGAGNWCDYRYDNYGYDWVWVCSYSYYNQVNIQAGHSGGRAIYYSHEFYFYWDPYYGSYYYSYGPYWSDYSWGSPIGLAQGATWDIRLEGANGNVFVASPTVLPTYSYEYNYGSQPYGCTSYSWWDGTGLWCYGYSNRYKYSEGWVGF